MWKTNLNSRLVHPVVLIINKEMKYIFVCVMPVGGSGGPEHVVKITPQI
jgi:hypothetical protein